MISVGRLVQLLEDRRVHVFLRVLLLALAVLFLAQTYKRAHRPLRYDFAGYLEASKALQRGGDPYRTPGQFPFIYPLFLAVAILPLANVPYSAAVGLWFLTSVVCAWLACRIIGRLGARMGNPALASGLCLAGLLAFLDPLQIDLLNGQANLEVLLLTLIFIERYLAGSRGIASVALGAAIAVKMVPGIFLLFLAARRQWRMIALAAATALLLSLSPALLVGGAVFRHYQTYVREFVLGHAQSAWLTGWKIWFTPYHLVGHLVPSLEGSLPVRYGVVGAALVGLGTVAWRAAPGVAELWCLCLYLVAIPMLLPMSEVHHLVIVMPAAFLLTFVALRPGAGGRAAAVSALMFWAFFWSARLHREGPYYFFALCALCVGLVALARRESLRPWPSVPSAPASPAA